jgi:transposase
MIQHVELFQQALGLERPWQVVSYRFSAEEKQLVLQIDFEPGGRFACPECGRSGCTAYDTSEKTWRHLNFFQHEAHIRARVPRVQCPEHGIRTVALPWARPGSGFTLLFEAYVLTLAREMPMSAVAALVGENDTRLWRILAHYVEQARSEQDLSALTHLGIDETASKRGHHYISLFVDLEEARVLFATEGKDAGTVAAFREELEQKGGVAEQIQEVCIDMSAAFIKGVGQSFPLAEMTFDKFHVMKLVNEAVDEVRRAEQKERPELKGSRFVWLKNERHWTKRQREIFEELSPQRVNLKTVRAHQIKRAFQEFWTLPPGLAEAFLKRWNFWATHSRLPPIIQAARAIRRHEPGILRWFTSRISNGVLEGINGLVQAARARARGYRNVRNLVMDQSRMTRVIQDFSDIPRRRSEGRWSSRLCSAVIAGAISWSRTASLPTASRSTSAVPARSRAGRIPAAATRRKPRT